MSEIDIKKLQEEVRDIRNLLWLFPVIFVFLLLFEFLYVSPKGPLIIQMCIGVVGAIVGSCVTYFFTGYLTDKNLEAACRVSLLKSHADLNIQNEEISAIKSIANDEVIVVQRIPSERLKAIALIDLPYNVFNSKKLKKYWGKLFVNKHYELIVNLSRCSRICLEIKALLQRIQYHLCEIYWQQKNDYKP